MVLHISLHEESRKQTGAKVVLLKELQSQLELRKDKPFMLYDQQLPSWRVCVRRMRVKRPNWQVQILLQPRMSDPLDVR